MGELWRAEEMQLIQLYIQIDAGHDTVEELGKLGAIQFRDLNAGLNSFQRSFIGEVKRADEMLRKLRKFQQQIDFYNADAELLGAPLLIVDANALEIRISIEELEARENELLEQIDEINSNQLQLTKNHHQLIEMNYVLEFKFSNRIGEHLMMQENISRETHVKFSYITGLILTSKFSSLEKVLFRATRGNLLIKYEELKTLIKDPVTGKLQQKSVFIVFSQGERLSAKILKICESFQVNIYQLPETQADRARLSEQVNERIEILKILLDKGLKQRAQILEEIASQLIFWKNKVIREKMIYHTMNKFNYDVGRRCLIAEGWCPVDTTRDIQLALRIGRDKSGALIPSVLDIITTRESPPTYFKTNKVTQGFQDIVSSYGVARYGEINPAVFTIVTFPFEFGVMFGDVGHGFMLLLLALGMIYKERHWEGKKLNEMIRMVYQGRYTILLMSLWSLYIGSLYNECFALPINFGSNYKLDYSNNMTFTWKKQDRTYLWGVDPVWKGATNELLYYNSLKMKTSVIIGILQMTLGLILHLLNSIKFKNHLDIWFEFVPRIIFLWSTFGYLMIIIFVKWNTNYFYPKNRTNQAPGLLNVMINMFLGGPIEDPLFAGQEGIEKSLIIIALICVPLMFFPKPLILHLEYKARKKGIPSIWALFFRDKSVTNIEPDQPDESIHYQRGHSEHDDITEMWVHQGLETIEFVLGCISHTASYLRLWALSLAHSELSTVFYDKIVADNWNLALEYSKSNQHSSFGYFLLFFFTFLGVSGWLAATLFIIMSMETLSAFLHALRLHWVEFQSKFYKGDGYQFKPLAFKPILFIDLEDDEPSG